MPPNRFVRFEGMMPPNSKYPPDKISGYLEIGTNGRGEIVINHPGIVDGPGHFVFSPRQAKHLAESLLKRVKEAEDELRVIDELRRTVTDAS